METGFDTTQLYSACKLTIRHYYPDNDYHLPDPDLGTGFVVEFPHGDNRVGLVTNRHLVDRTWEHPGREGTVPKKIEIEMWQSADLRLEFPIDDPVPYYHEDSSLDVTVIPFGPGIDGNIIGHPFASIDTIFPDRSIEVLPMRHGLSWDFLLECERLWPQLKPGELVAFPGYPIWYDRLQNRPVFRSGLIASDPQTDYRFTDESASTKDGNRQILFDAFSTKGNSGSPVYVAQRGLAPVNVLQQTSDGITLPKPAGKMSFPGYHPAFLIGINAGHYVKDTSEHAGLSRMFKLSAIMDILRANTTPTPGEPRASVLIPKDEADAYTESAQPDESAVAEPKNDRS